MPAKDLQKKYRYAVRTNRFLVFSDLIIISISSGVTVARNRELGLLFLR